MEFIAFGVYCVWSLFEIYRLEFIAFGVLFLFILFFMLFQNTYIIIHFQFYYFVFDMIHDKSSYNTPMHHSKYLWNIKEGGATNNCHPTTLTLS